ncbi:hypothetical protein [Oceanicella sp. SM1341]|uniref:hypothetical protein n=1 Tax=Oceanicella sp. SM1341 TaxID=1548889 RepID=UPI000E51DC38|nr:hypothetical protein [Oceanicella sp. SM1341]
MELRTGWLIAALVALGAAAPMIWPGGPCGWTERITGSGCLSETRIDGLRLAALDPVAATPGGLAIAGLLDEPVLLRYDPATRRVTERVSLPMGPGRPEGLLPREDGTLVVTCTAGAPCAEGGHSAVEVPVGTAPVARSIPAPGPAERRARHDGVETADGGRAAWRGDGRQIRLLDAGGAETGRIDLPGRPGAARWLVADPGSERLAAVSAHGYGRSVVHVLSPAKQVVLRRFEVAGGRPHVVWLDGDLLLVTEARQGPATVLRRFAVP